MNQLTIRDFENDSSQRRCRAGVSTLELVISSVLLLTVMSFVTTICFHINLVWKDINHHRIAVGELSNQLEELTKLSKDDAQQAIDSLEPSSVVLQSLPKPKLEGELMDDEFGTRIELNINWKRKNPGKPVSLVGWIVAEPLSPGQEEGE